MELPVLALIVLALALVIAAAPFVALYGAGQAVRRKIVRRRLAHEWDGFHAWAARVGVTPSPAPADGEWRGTIELGGFTVDVSVDTSALDRRRATPSRLTLRASLEGRAPEDLRVVSGGFSLAPLRMTSLSGLSVLGGEDLGLFAFMHYDLCLALRTSLTGSLGWSSVELTGRTIKFVCDDVVTLLGVEGELRAEDLFGLAANVLREIPERYDAPALLAERAASDREPDDVRWGAGRALFETFWKTPELEAFVSRASHMDDTAQMMCALWGVYMAVDLSVDARVDLLVRAGGVAEVSGDADDALVNEYGWSALMDARLPDALRLRAAKRALTSPGAPDEPHLVDAALSELVLDASPDTPRGDALLAPLMTGGWRPEEHAMTALARRGDARLRKALVKQLQRLGARPEDTPALVELAGAGVSGARELLESLRGGGAHGMLSLSSDDPARGGLTQSTGRGGLTRTDDK